MINVFQPCLRQQELSAVNKVFNSNWLGKGQETKKFEQEFAQHLHHDENYVKSISCASAGLFSSVDLLDIEEGDEVIMPSIHFVAAANAVYNKHGEVVLCDVNPRTLNITAEEIEKKITNKTKAINLIHYGGYPCEMDEICQLAKDYNLKLIEDAACSVSSTYKDKACGTFGDIGIWSFDAMKILVCGDGGMVCFNDEELAHRFEKDNYLGLCTKSGYENSVDAKWWEFDISSYGRREIMNDINSSIGREQLKKLDGFIERRKEIHDTYNLEFEGSDWLVRPPELKKCCTSSYYFYWIQLKDEDTRNRLATYLRQEGIYTTFRYYPLHWVKYYNFDCKLPNAEKAALTTLCIPIHQSLTELEVEKIISKIKEFGRINNL